MTNFKLTSLSIIFMICLDFPFCSTFIISRSFISNPVKYINNYCTSIRFSDLQNTKFSNSNNKIGLFQTPGFIPNISPNFDNKKLFGNDNNHQLNDNNNEKKQQQRYIHPQVYKMFKRAQELIRIGNNTVATKLLHRCLELNPYDSHSWLAIARLEAKLCNYQRSRELFSSAIEKCPNNVHLLHGWGHMEERHGSEAIARECWSQAMEIEPLNPYVCHALSNLERRLRNFDRARQILENVVKFQPTSALCVSLAELERLQGQPEKARETLRNGLRVCRRDRSKLLLALAWIEEDAFNNYEIAKKHIAEAIRVDVNNIFIYLAKANMELRRNNVNDARITLRAACQLKSEDGQHYTMLGTLESDYGNFQEAVRVLEEGAGKFPGDQFLLQRWGTLEAKRGNIEKARVLFERSVEIQPHAPTFVAWAILEEEVGIKSITPISEIELPAVALESSSIHPAINRPVTRDTILLSSSSSSSSSSSTSQSISELVVTTPTNSVTVSVPITDEKNKKRAMEVRASLVLDSQLNRSRELFQFGLLVDSRHGPLYHAYGNMEMRHGNNSGARSIFMQGIRNNCSEVTSIYHALGLLEQRENKFEKAAQIFRSGIELGCKGDREIEHGLSFLLHSLGMLEMTLHRVAEARKVFQRGVEKFPQNSPLLLGLAMSEMKLGNVDEARKYFSLSVDIDPLHSHAWQAWAVAEKGLGNISTARSLFMQGLKRNPTHGALWQALAVMELQLGNIEVARAHFAEAIVKCPNHAQSYQAWSCLEVKSGNLEIARKLAFRGISKAPGHAALWTVAGVVEGRLGRFENAKKILENGIARFSNHGPLYKAMGELESRQREGFSSLSYLKAREIFAKGLEKDPDCAQLYHAAALLEAKLGNLEGILHIGKLARSRFQKNVLHSSVSSSLSDNEQILERIKNLEVSAIEKTKGNPNSNTNINLHKSSKNTNSKSNQNNNKNFPVSDTFIHHMTAEEEEEEEVEEHDEIYKIEDFIDYNH